MAISWLIFTEKRHLVWRVHACLIGNMTSMDIFRNSVTLYGTLGGQVYQAETDT